MDVALNTRHQLFFPSLRHGTFYTGFPKVPLSRKKKKKRMQPHDSPVAFPRKIKIKDASQPRKDRRDFAAVNASSSAFKIKLKL